VSGQEAGDVVDSVTLEIDLMAVNDEDSLVGLNVLQDQPLVGCQPILLNSTVLKALDIVIAEEHMETILASEGVQQVEGASVRAPHNTEPPVLPQLIPVTDFNVGEPLAMVVRQCLEEKVLILREGIGTGVIAPVEIAEEDETRTVVEWDSPGRTKGLG
jgi:hypothetical protein